MFTETMQSWQNFYFMAGGASAGLLGLMFVALSLGINLVLNAPNETSKAFVTPSVVYFISVLLASCTMLIPDTTPPMLALLLIGGGTWGMVKTLRHVIRLIETARQRRDFNLGDWLAQIICPVLGFALVLVSAVLLLIGEWSIGFSTLWLAVVLLLTSAVANTWNLVVWIIDQSQTR